MPNLRLRERGRGEGFFAGHVVCVGHHSPGRDVVKARSMDVQAARPSLFRELYAGFVRARRYTRHFRRFTLFESLLRDTASREVLPPLADALLKASRANPEQVLASLGSHAAWALASSTCPCSGGRNR